MSENMKNERKRFDKHIRAAFRGEKTDRIVWQPRFPDWYDHNHIWGLNETNYKSSTKTEIPREFWGADLLDCYDLFDASPRYFGEGWPGLGQWPPYKPFDLGPGVWERMHIFYTEENPDADITHQWGTDDDPRKELHQ